MWCRATGFRTASARENGNDIDNHFNLCYMRHRPRPLFFGPRSGFVCIDNATFRVEEALAAAGARSTEGVKQEEARGDIVALRRGPSRLLLRTEASGFKEKPTHHPSCAMASHPPDTTIRSKNEGKKKESQGSQGCKLIPSCNLIMFAKYIVLGSSIYFFLKIRTRE